MKKTWLYVGLIVALALGFFYVVLEKPEEADPGIDDNIAEEEGEKEIPEESQEEPSSDQKPDEELADKDVETSDSPEIGKRLPDFTLKNLDGQDVTLSEIEDKIIIVNFWATWCKWCKEEMPDIQKIKEENDDVLVLAVNVDEPKDQAKEYIEDGGYDFEVLLDEDGAVSAQYLVTGLPASYFVDENGVFADRVPSAISYEQIEDILNEIRNQ